MEQQKGDAQCKYYIEALGDEETIKGFLNSLAFRSENLVSSPMLNLFLAVAISVSLI